MCINWLLPAFGLCHQKNNILQIITGSRLVKSGSFFTYRIGNVLCIENTVADE